MKKTRSEEQNPVGWVEKRMGMTEERVTMHARQVETASGLVWFGIKG